MASIGQYGKVTQISYRNLYLPSSIVQQAVWMYVSIGGRWTYLWRAIDQEGEVLRLTHGARWLLPEQSLEDFPALTV